MSEIRTRQDDLTSQERIALLEQKNVKLQMDLKACRREHCLLKASATAANALLTVSSFDEAVKTALQIIGESLDTDRVTVIENFNNSIDSSSLWWRVSYEWNSFHTVPQISHSKLAQGSYEGIKEWCALFSRGQSISCLLEDMPEPFRSRQAEIDVKALHTVPIFVEGKWWGVIGFDDCREAKHRSAAELAVLKIAANCVGNAIQRERMQKALLRAEQERVSELAKVNEERRQCDHLLSVVAQVTKELLAAEDVDAAIPAALQAVGEVADISRVLLILEHLDPSTKRLKHCVAHEWVASRFTDHAAVGLSVMDNEDFQVLIQPLYAGRSVWRVINDLPDGIRSQLEKLEIKSTGVVPIFIAGRYIGCVAFDDCVTPRHWSQQEIDVLTAAAETIGAVIHRKQLVDRLIEERIRAEQERAAELAKANDVLRRSVSHLTTTDNLQSFLIAVLQEAIRASGALTATVFVYDSFSNTLQKTVLVLHGEVIDIATDPRAEIWRSPVPADITDAWRVMSQSRQILWIDNDSPGPEHWPVAVAWHRQFGHRNIAAIPLLLGEQALGFMGLAFATYQQPSESRLEQCWALAQHAAIALQMADLVQQTKQTALLEERNRMAREIHDTIAQVLTGIIIQLEATKGIVSTQPEAAHDHLTRASTLAREGLAEARRSVRALRAEALESRDLPTALNHLVQQMTTDTSVQANVCVTGDPYPLPSDVEVNLLRIGQEALTNALKHAQAQTVCLNLYFNIQTVQLQILDDGQGFDPQQLASNCGFGLIGMQERSQRLGGTFALVTNLGAGTKITVTAPTQGLPTV